ncbi:hypothetical protein RIF29_09254 [Crotalaria pallida]|uniref:Uncharacterized protein n=1 Tax=Crotalaria pallida TaxID=3830 RepID=A0AAN9IJK4_CROPI
MTGHMTILFLCIIEKQVRIGQTLRIRIGPLKGYLCRVIVLCRNDVTVKLDSQQKVLTVKCEHLSEVQAKGTTARLVGKGFVYIEAERQCHINEVTSDSPGDFDQLVHWHVMVLLIMAVNNTTKKVTVKLIPRIDLQALAAKLALERMGHVDEIVNT